MTPEKLQTLREIEAALREHDFPPQLIIENTAHCNFRCRHCHHHELQREQGTMSDELWTKLISEVAARHPDTEVWPTFYGEALGMGPRIYERIRQARALGLTNLVLNSNGSFCRDGNNQDILTCGLRRFLLSLDGFTKDTFESIRCTFDPHGKFEPVYAGVGELLRRQKELAAEGVETPTIICQFSRMEENAHEVDAFRDYWTQRGAHVKIREKLTWTGYVPAPNLTPDYTQRIACPWANNTCAILWNGDVAACAVDNEGAFVAGNVNEQSISEIWRGPLRKMRKAHRRHFWDDVPKVCQGCLDWQAVGASHYTPEGQAYHSVVVT